MSGKALIRGRVASRPGRSHRVVVVARLTIATLAGSLALLATPVISTGSGVDPITPTVTEERISPDSPVVSASFDLAGVALDAGSPVDAVEVRVRDDDGWSGWTMLEVIDDAGPDQGTREHAGSTRMTEPVLAVGGHEIEVRVPDGESAAVILVDGGAVAGGPAQSASAAPTVITRADWGADPSLMNCTPTSLAGYRGAVVHHTVNANEYSMTQAPALVRSIYAYHTTALGWCDVGYQFLVDRFGRVYEGRSGSLNRAVMGAQSAGFNSQTFGVSIIGDFTAATPSPESLAAVDSVIQWQLALDGVDPSGVSEFTSAGNGKFPEGTVVRLPNVMGHRDNGQTECPGAGLYTLLPSFRRPLMEPIEPDPRVERIAGPDRYSTSAQVSSQGFTAPVPVAYLASGTTFPDALSGAPAAASLGGPLRITHPDRLPAAIAAELTRLRPRQIVILGSSGSVSDAVADAVQEYTTGAVVRLGGPDRYATSAMISAAAFAPDRPVAFIATGSTFPDALSGGPAAAALGGPLLLTRPTVIPAAIAEELRRLRPARIVVLGSHPTVDDTVVDALQGFTVGGVTRLAGPDRYATSAMTSRDTFSTGVPVAYVATGRNFPDALSGAPAAGVSGGPLMITDPDRISPPVAEELARLRPGRIVVLGSHPTVSRRVQLSLAEFVR